MIRVDPTLCKDHGECFLVCPEGAIGYRDGQTSIDPHLCHECGACIRACPEGAIDEVRSARVQSSDSIIVIRDEAMHTSSFSAAAPAQTQALPATQVILTSVVRRGWLPALGSALIWAGREIVPQVIRVWRASTADLPQTSVSTASSGKIAEACGGNQTGGQRRRFRQRQGGRPYG